MLHDSLHRLSAVMTTRRPGVRLAVIALVALLVRAVTFGNPILLPDEEFYFVAADRWLHGILPYVGTWDRKPIGLFLVYLPAAAFGPVLGIIVYQALALCSLVATAWAIARLADRAGWTRGALAGALAYVLWANLIEGEGGQAPIFYNLLMVGAALLIAPPAAGPVERWRGLAAMALVGVALQIKYSVVFEGLFFGLWLLWCEVRQGRRWTMLPYAAALMALAGLPTVFAWLSYRAIGAEETWVFANVTSIQHRARDGLAELSGNFLALVAIVSPLFAAVWLGRRLAGEPVAGALAVRRWVWAWLGSAAFGVLVFGTYFDHYALPLLVPATIAASGFFGYHRDGRRLGFGLLALALIGGQAMVLGARYMRGTPAEFARLVAAIGGANDPVRGCLYVYSGEPMAYTHTGRCAPTRYLFPSHLQSRRENGAVGVEQATEITRIMATRPAIVTLRPLGRGEEPARRALLMAALQRDYRVRAVLPLGTRPVTVFERR